MSEINSEYHIKRLDGNVFYPMVAKIHEWFKAGEEMTVCVSPLKCSRSLAQNRVFHMWAADVAKATGEAKHGGRLKLQYFVPILMRAEGRKFEQWQWTWKIIQRRLSYEQQIEFLGTPNLLGVTSVCDTKQFAEALTNIWQGECEHGLRDPQLYGLDWNVKEVK